MSKKENKKHKEQIKNQKAKETVKNIVSKEELGSLESLQEEIKTEQDKYLRLFAEFENYKKRTSKERIELFKSANQELMSVLLPIVDDFERGLKEIKKVKDKQLLKGMELIYDKLTKTLQQKGLTEVDVKNGDTFDAEIHEAITQIPASSEDLKGKIIDTIEKGYKLGDKIIRYPKVIIGQ